MTHVIHKSENRGSADHGWLKATHSFSFANFYNPNLMGFGLLRVLNDDLVAPDRGFDTHPHKNMEIVTIPLEGKLAHKDSMGNESEILPGEVQAMSAGKGVLHSEFNASPKDSINLFQIWIMPDKHNIEPRYDQQHFDASERQNVFQTIVSPLGTDDPGVKLNQTTYFKRADISKGQTITYQKEVTSNGIYIMVIEGDAIIDGHSLSRRDAIGVTEQESVEISASVDTSILVIEVPME